MKSIKKQVTNIVFACVLLVIVLIGASSFNKYPLQTVNCTGEQRWEVKTLQDKTSASINFTPMTISFAEILNMKKIKGWSLAKDNPRQPDEFQVYTVQGKIAFVDTETDGDIHIELMDEKDASLHLVAEIPNPDCDITKMTDKKYLDMFRKTRNEWMEKYNDELIWSHGTFEITGILFHDKSNHGTGGNQNGVELHPVITINKIN